MSKIIALLFVAVFLFFIAGCMSSYTMSKNRPECITAESDSATSQDRSVSTVCFHDDNGGESLDDSCFSIKRQAHWYFDHSYPPRYSVFYYRRFGTCPPYMYYAADCDCCKRSGPAGAPSAKASEDGPIHETK